MQPWDYIEAARVPRSLAPQEFGLWTIQRLAASPRIIENNLLVLGEELVGFPDYTLLRRVTDKNIHLETGGEIVMEDSARELRKHLPIWLAARGRVLITGLGLGCVGRGLLAKPEVEHINVVEIDRQIIRVIGAEFRESRRITIHHADALKIDLPGRFDFAWHDLWCEDNGLQLLHMQLFIRFHQQCGRQGAWAFPRKFAKLLARRKNFLLLGAPR